MKTLALAALLLAALPLAARGEGDVPAGQSLLPDTPPFGLELSGRIDAAAVEVVDGAVVARTTDAVPRAWSVQLVAPTVAAVEEGDTLYAEFRLRGKGELGAEATTEFVFERAGEPYVKSAERSVSAGPGGWTLVQVPFRAAGSYAPGEARVGFRLGYPPQTIEIAGLRLLNLGRDVDPADLPRTIPTYPGSADDAPWRAEAAERIDRLRKGDLTVRVVRRDGTPVAGAIVEVEMTRHAFPFGTAVARSALFDDSADGERYGETLRAWFNYATPENALKQNAFEGGGEDEGAERAIEIVDRLNAMGLRVRGHNLLWPGWHPWFLPARLREGHARRAEADPEYARRWLAAELRQHLVAKAAAFRGKVVGWDVANEVANNREVMEILGDTDASDAALAGWFALLRDVDPRAGAYLNDYGILVNGGANRRLIDRYLAQAKNLADAGQPPDAIGVQCHFFTGLTGPRTAWRLLDELHATGVPVEVTEYDVVTGDEALDGRFTRDFLTACFAHEGVEAFVVWGFWEGRHWRPQSAFFRRDWSLRPTGQAWRDLVLGEWWTRQTTPTDAAGLATVRGFLGDYAVRVGGVEVATTLTRQGREVLVEVE